MTAVQHHSYSASKHQNEGDGDHPHTVEASLRELT
jgi:hypothetical protein